MLTYNHLYDLVRRERSHQELQELPGGFYDDSKLFFDQLQATAHASPFSSEGEASRMQLLNGKKLLKQLYEYREQKILSLAQNRCRTGSSLVDTSKLLPTERELYDAVIIQLENARHKNYLDGVAAIAPSSHVETPVEQTSVETSSENITSSLITIKVVKAVPQFLGKDMEEYGPFAEDEVVELPEGIAQVLIRRGNALHGE